MEPNWSLWASCIGSLMVPILTGINIWVFIKLTKVIDQNNAGRQKEELEFQKRRILTEMRQSELNKLVETLDGLGTGSSFLEVEHNFMFCFVSIDSFLNQRQGLFPLVENSSKYQSLIDLHAKIRDLKKLFSDGKKVENGEVAEILKLKHKVIAELQQYILDNI